MKKNEQKLRNLRSFLRFCLDTKNLRGFPKFSVVVVTLSTYLSAISMILSSEFVFP